MSDKNQLKQQFEESVRPLWAFIDKKYQWLAIDSDGDVCCYKAKPAISDDNHGSWWWRYDGGAYLKAVTIPIPNGLTWRDTLVERPNG